VFAQRAILFNLDLLRTLPWSHWHPRRLADSSDSREVQILRLVGHSWTSNMLHCHGLRDTNVCALCSQQVETSDYLLIDYVFSWEMWFRTFRHILVQDLALDDPYPSLLGGSRLENRSPRLEGKGSLVGRGDLVLVGKGYRSLKSNRD
jgi:hypothetical protein